MKPLARLILVVLCAAFCFGGTFTCKGSQNSDRFTQNPDVAP